MDERGSKERNESQGVSPDEAFELLGDETRIAILQALWETPDEAVPFSELRRRIGNPDSGHFNYHLGKLADHFVRKTDDGYALRTAGRAVVQAVLSGTLTQRASLEPFEYDEYCPYCGAEDAMVFDRKYRPSASGLAPEGEGRTPGLHMFRSFDVPFDSLTAQLAGGDALDCSGDVARCVVRMGRQEPMYVVGGDMERQNMVSV